MATKRPIPAIPLGDASRNAFDAAVRENIELLTGQRGGVVMELPVDASLTEVVAKLNEVIRRINYK